MSPKKAANERHFRVPAHVYQSEAFATLPPSAIKMWVDMRTQLNSFNNGLLDATMRTMAKRGWTSPETLHKAIVDNLTRGLIVRTREGKPGPARICNLYGFTDLAIVSNEAKHVTGAQPTRRFIEWKPGMSFAPPISGSKRLPKSRDTEIVSTPVRKSKRYQYENRSVDESTSTKTVSRKNGRIARKPAPVVDLP